MIETIATVMCGILFVVVVTKQAISIYRSARDKKE